LVKQSFEETDRLLEKIYWLDKHMDPEDKLREKKKDWRYSKLIAFPKHKNKNHE